MSAAHADGGPLFAHRGFVLPRFARLAGVAASQMLMLAVAWQMYDLTGRGLLLAVSVVLGAVRALSCSPWRPAPPSTCCISTKP